MAQVWELEAGLKKAWERKLEAQLRGQEHANPGLRANIAAFGTEVASKSFWERVEGSTGSALDSAAHRTYDNCHRQLDAGESRADLGSSTGPEHRAGAAAQEYGDNVWG